MSSSSRWQRFQQYFLHYGELGFSIDISRMKFPDDFFEKMQPKVDKAFAAMRELEAGTIANPDEGRMVGHYWLRNPALAPSAEFRADIEQTNKRIKEFATDLHAGKIGAENGKRFEHILHIGIGGSAPGHNSWQTRWDHGTIRWTLISSITPIRTASIASSTSSTSIFRKRSSWSFPNLVGPRKHEMECWRRKQNSKQRGFNSTGTLSL